MTDDPRTLESRKVDQRHLADPPDVQTEMVEQHAFADIIACMVATRQSILARKDLSDREKTRLLRKSDKLLATALGPSVENRWTVPRIVLLAVLGIMLMAVVLTTNGDKRKSPYVANPSRLGDVVAAIQALGTYEWHNKAIAYWQDRDRLGAPRSVDTSQVRASSDSAKRHEAWRTVFAEHPEFFRLRRGDDRVALHWRWTGEPNYEPEGRGTLSPQQIDSLPEAARASLSRAPLRPEQIGTLMTTAFQLHNQALTYEQERRWLLPLVSTLAGVFLGALLKRS